MLVFLDFDGVLRRHSSSPRGVDVDCLNRFESAVRKYAAARIVISSSWRLVTPLAMLRTYFSADVGFRIDGVTPQAFDDRPHARYREIRTYLKRRNEEHTPWIAIDDFAPHFPSGAPLLLVDGNQGFDAQCAAKLTSFLRCPHGAWKQMRTGPSAGRRRQAESRIGFLLRYGRSLVDGDQ